MTKTEPPRGLAARGSRFWRLVVTDYDLEPGELELLVEICRTLDDLEALAAVVAKAGATVAGSSGQPRLHPALAEMRGSRLALGRLLDQLALPDQAGEVLSVRSARAQRAAMVRWADHIPRGRRGQAS